MDRPVTPETFHLFMTLRLNGPAPDKWTGKICTDSAHEKKKFLFYYIRTYCDRRIQHAERKLIV